MLQKARPYYDRLKRRYARIKNEQNKRPLANGLERIYHVHIRKTAGTSVNAAFWELGNKNLDDIKRKTLFLGNEFIFVRNDRELVCDGNYFFANSHIPFWKLELPPKTYTFCFMRDPVERLVSLYKYYGWIISVDPKIGKSEEPYYAHVLREAKDFIGGSFTDFVGRLDKEHLLSQVHMFSENYDPEEAFARINELSAVFFQSEFETAIQKLNSTLGLNLNVRHDRKSEIDTNFTLSTEELNFVKEKLKVEYEFYEKCLSAFK